MRPLCLAQLSLSTKLSTVFRQRFVFYMGFLVLQRSRLQLVPPIPDHFHAALAKPPPLDVVLWLPFKRADHQRHVGWLRLFGSPQSPVPAQLPHHSCAFVHKLDESTCDQPHYTSGSLPQHNVKPFCFASKLWRKNTESHHQRKRTSNITLFFW